MRRRFLKYLSLRGQGVRPGNVFRILNGKNEGMCRKVVKFENGIITVDCPFPNEIEVGTSFEPVDTEEVKQCFIAHYWEL